MIKKQRTATGISAGQDECLTIRMNTMSISKELLKAIKDNYPAIFQRKEAITFLYILGTSIARCSKTGGILFSRKRLARLLKRAETKVRLREFLEEMKIIFPELEWTEYEFLEGACTVIINTGLKELLELIINDLPNERIILNTMREATRRNKRAYAKEIERLFATRIFRNQDAQMISQYLLKIPYSYYEEAEENFLEAFTQAIGFDQEIKESIENRNSVQETLARINKSDPKESISTSSEKHHRSTLLAVRDMWKPFYHEVKHSPRLFGTEPTFLKTALRKILYPNWVDFDIKNCQLVVVAHLFNLPLCLEFLDTGRSIWDYLVEYMGIDPGKYIQAKEFLKPALYSIIFGMEKSDAQENLENELVPRGILWNKRFTSSPIIKEIATTLRKEKEKIEEDGGMMGIYGWVILEGDITAKGVLACVVQGYELYAITACYEVAFQEKEKGNWNETYDIVIHQHDGVSIRLKKGGDLMKIQANFQVALEERMEVVAGMGKHMRIEYKPSSSSSSDGPMGS